MNLARGVAGLAAAAAAAAAVAGCFPTGDSAFTVINRTTVPIVVVDWKSVSVVAACSERTIAWHGTWGGNDRYEPVAEPVPAGAWTLPAANLAPEVIEGPVVRQVVVTSAGVTENGDRNAPCDGPPPPSPAASASASEPASASPAP